MYTLDTNVIIYHLKGDPEAAAILEEVLNQSGPLFISAITEIELFGYPALSLSEAKNIEFILSTLTVIAIDSRIARGAGQLRRIYGLGIADSAIAATALFTGSTLLTRNTRDFRKIPKLQVQRI